MDGVLVDSSAHHRASWRALLAELAVPEPPDFWRLTIGRPAQEAVPHLLARVMPPDEAARLARRKNEHYVRASAAGLPAVAGAPAFVRDLVARGVPCGVGTSAHRHDAERLLAALGLREHFGALVAAEDVARGKPDPDVYLRAAAGLGVTPDACLVFEDAAVGVVAARRAGMRVIGLTTAYPAEELLAAGAERTIPDFLECVWPV